MRIVILDDIGIGAGDVRRLEERGEVRVCCGVPSGDDEIVARARDAHIVISGWTKISDEVLASLPDLQLILLWATGLDSIDRAAASTRNVVVCHVPAYATNAVAELALGLMLAVTRRIPAADQYLRRTRSSDWQPFQGSELNGKTLGVVGTGVIGQRVARLGHCLGMSLLAYDVQPSQSLIDDFRIRYVPLSELFAKSDVVTLHAPLTPATEGLVDHALLRRLPTTAIIINTARAGLIVQDDLLEVLRSRAIAGAGLDVIDLERESGLQAPGTRERGVHSAHRFLHARGHGATHVHLRGKRHPILGRCADTTSPRRSMMPSESLLVTIPSGSTSLQAKVPRGVRTLFNGEFEELPAVTDDFEGTLLSRLEQPTAGPPLREIAESRTKALVLVDDNTRHTPVDRILPTLFNYLNEIGLTDDDIEILTAPGTHRLMTEEELLAKVGGAARRRVAITQHDCRDILSMIDQDPVQAGSSLIPIQINRKTLDADLIIGLGSIFPHSDAGFTGKAQDRSAGDLRYDDHGRHAYRRGPPGRGPFGRREQ